MKSSPFPLSVHSGETVRELDALKKVLEQLRSSGRQIRLSVGCGVHLANSAFISRYGGIERFRCAPAAEQKFFCAELSDLELGARAQDMGIALGVGLYRIWLTEFLTEHGQLAEVLGQELAELSRRSGD